MSTAIACSNCARPTPTSTSCARVDSSCVRACATSAPDATPASNRSWVNCNDCSNMPTFRRSRSVSASRP